MKPTFFLFANLLALVAVAQKGSGFAVIENRNKKEVNVFYNDRLLTAYCYADSLFKPILYPLNTVDGITVTRGWPLQPRGGERTDHPHHTGVWMNYESVNGLDFWNNSSAIPAEKKGAYGRIRHDGIKHTKAAGNSAAITTGASWLHPNGHTILTEETIHSFVVKDDRLLIARTTALLAKEDVVFKDVKDGFFALRLARELEMPSSQEDVFTDVHGNKTGLPKMKNNDGVTGQYISSEGKTGDSVWGTRAAWAMLYGKKEGKDITIGIFDHRSNVGFPAYWHARGYGLFAVNPFGQKVFSNGKEVLNFTLKKGASKTFRYLLVIASGKKLLPADMNKLGEDFSKR